MRLNLRLVAVLLSSAIAIGCAVWGTKPVSKSSPNSEAGSELHTDEVWLFDEIPLPRRTCEAGTEQGWQWLRLSTPEPEFESILDLRVAAVGSAPFVFVASRDFIVDLVSFEKGAAVAFRARSPHFVMPAPTGPIACSADGRAFAHVAEKGDGC